MGTQVQKLTASERATELLAQMTVEEKVAQIVGILPHAFGATSPQESLMREHMGHGIGHIGGIGTTGVGPVAVAKLANTIQKFLVENTRLGIPAIFHNEALNGVTAEGFSSFPTSIGLAATFNPEKVEEMAQLLRKQLRSVGVHQALAPVLDVARDARWGRIHETYGEDVLLSSAFGVAYVRGIQGEDRSTGVIATAKHFLGYAMTEGGQNMAATHAGPRELRDVHSATFEAAIRQAGLGSVMNSYSEIDGQPVGVSREILTDLLRGELDFDGTVVSDYRSLYYIVNRQGVGNVENVGAAGLHAGLDVELPAPFGYGPELIEGLKAGRVSMADLDLSVHRVLTQKFELGLFENPYVDVDEVRLPELAASGRELSRTLAEESVTLLKNEGGVLPLAATTKSIAVLGPHADSVMAGFGNYTHPPFLETLRAIALGRSNLAGMEQMAGNADDEKQREMRARMEAMARLDPEAIARRDYGAKSLFEALTDAFPDAQVTTVGGYDVQSAEEGALDAALQAAADAEVIVLALGGRSAAFQGRATEGEGSDSATLELPQAQRELVFAAAKLGKPVIAVLYAGKPYALAELEPHLDAIITDYIPGPEGGVALAAAIRGEVNPSGKLPFTVPRHVGQVPIFHAQKQGSGHRRFAHDQFKAYVDLENTPLYPFGHGLSYAQVELSDFSAVISDDSLRASATISHVGGPAGAHVVQLYASAPASLITRPGRQLAAFARVELAPGEQAQVEFTVPLERFAYTCEDGRIVVDPGTYGLAVGLSSEDLHLTGEVEVAGERREVATPNATLPQATVTPKGK